MKCKQLAALLLSALLALSLLAGCAAPASSGGSGSEASAAASSAESGAASSESAPNSQAEASASLHPGQFDENGYLLISDPSEAFGSCLGWGPGSSGCSLKSVIAAAALLDWAEENHLSQRTEEMITTSFTEWYDALSAAEQENFAESWPLVEADAESLIKDKSSMTGRIEDAGLDPDALPGCTFKNWQALQQVLNAQVPEALGEY